MCVNILGYEVGAVNVYCGPKAFEVNRCQVVDPIFYFMPLEDDMIY